MVHSSRKPGGQTVQHRYSDCSIEDGKGHLPTHIHAKPARSSVKKKDTISGIVPRGRPQHLVFMGSCAPAVPHLFGTPFSLFPHTELPDVAGKFNLPVGLCDLGSRKAYIQPPMSHWIQKDRSVYPSRSFPSSSGRGDSNSIQRPDDGCRKRRYVECSASRRLVAGDSEAPCSRSPTMG